MPIRLAIQRDEETIERWRLEVWPELRRRARRERRVLVFEDEAGFYLLPGVVRTYAPEANTPVLRENQTRDHLSVLGGMTPAGKVYTLARQESLNGQHSVAFLQHLQHVAGERLLVWDGSPIRRRATVTQFVEDTRGKVWVEALPSYAPDLNLWDEGGLAPPQGRGAAQRGVPGLGRPAPRIPPRAGSLTPKAAPGPILLCPGGFADQRNLTEFAQRSVDAIGIQGGLGTIAGWRRKEIGGRPG